LSEPDFPYNKRPRPEETPLEIPPSPDYPPPPPSPPSPPPFEAASIAKASCQICGKTFNTKEELTFHVETAHESPKKKI
jgi:hypothetical protein